MKREQRALKFFGNPSFIDDMGASLKVS